MAGGAAPSKEKRQSKQCRASGQIKDHRRTCSSFIGKPRPNKGGGGTFVGEQTKERSELSEPCVNSRKAEKITSRQGRGGGLQVVGGGTTLSC